jgi:hypothetical protein
MSRRRGVDDDKALLALPTVSAKARNTAISSVQGTSQVFLEQGQSLLVGSLPRLGDDLVAIASFSRGIDARHPERRRAIAGGSVTRAAGSVVVRVTSCPRLAMPRRSAAATLVFPTPPLAHVMTTPLPALRFPPRGSSSASTLNDGGSRSTSEEAYIGPAELRNWASMPMRPKGQEGHFDPRQGNEAWWEAP